MNQKVRPLPETIILAVLGAMLIMAVFMAALSVVPVPAGGDAWRVTGRTRFASAEAQSAVEQLVSDEENGIGTNSQALNHARKAALAFASDSGNMSDEQAYRRLLETVGSMMQDGSILVRNGRLAR